MSDADPPPRFDEIYAKVRARPAPGRPKPSGQRPLWPIAIAVVVLGVSGWLLARKFQDDARIQDCVQSGRKNCAKIADPNER